MKIFIYHTPELTPASDFPDCAIAVDVLRATSTMATALSVGAEAIQVFSDLDELFRISESWPADKRLRAGERGGARIPGCDLGNSPLDCTPQRMAGQRLFITTTNGTRALQAIQPSKCVIAGAFVNRQAVARQTLAQHPETVWIVASGWEGGFSLEDTTCAGAIVDSLLTATQSKPQSIAGNDEFFSALALYQQWRNDLSGMLCAASHGQRLLRLNCHEDLTYCAQTDILNTVPIQIEPGVLVGVEVHSER
ncbi:MAG: 2-phosphosulfolactate phosphatase family protein [Synechococcales cyanobacterium]